MMIKEYHENTEDDLSYMDRYSRENFYKYLKDLSPKGTIIYESIEDDEEEEDSFKDNDIEDLDFDDVDWREDEEY